MSRLLARRVWRIKINKYFGACLFFLLPSLVGILIFVMVPFADVVRRSFLTAVTGEWNGVENYRTIFINQAFLLAVKNTLRFTAVGIPLLVVLGLVIAVPLCRLPARQQIKSLFLFPLAIPTATVVLVWKMVFYEQGFLNLIITEFGKLTGLFGPVFIDYMGTDASFFVLIISYLWKNTGYTVLLWMSGIMRIPGDIIEAAKVDGAGRMQNFFLITLPNLKSSLYTIVLLSFLNSFKVYREAYLVAGSYPQDKIYILQHLFNNWFVNLDFDKMAAAAVCTGAFLFVFIILLQKIWDRD